MPVAAFDDSFADFGGAYLELFLDVDNFILVFAVFVYFIIEIHDNIGTRINSLEWGDVQFDVVWPEGEVADIRDWDEGVFIRCCSDFFQGGFDYLDAFRGCERVVGAEVLFCAANCNVKVIGFSQGSLDD